MCSHLNIISLNIKTFTFYYKTFRIDVNWDPHLKIFPKVSIFLYFLFTLYKTISLPIPTGNSQTQHGHRWCNMEMFVVYFKGVMSPIIGNNYMYMTDCFNNWHNYITMIVHLTSSFNMIQGIHIHFFAICHSLMQNVTIMNWNTKSS